MEELNIKMVQIPAGGFEMGAPQEKWLSEGWLKDTLPVHTAELDLFFISAYKVPWANTSSFWLQQVARLCRIGWVNTSNGQ